MSEQWQPARYVQVHPMPFTSASNEKKCKTEVIHVRKAQEIGLAAWHVQELRNLGCTATEFFWIQELPRCWVCSCELLTD